MKYLIVGLGNVGAEYEGTRHNVGFDVLDKMIEDRDVEFSLKRLAYFADFKYRGRTIYLIKPTTFMNLSGKAIAYWMDKLSVKKSHVLVNVDDINIEFGRIRARSKGSDGGHNGLKDIQNRIGSDYSRIRIGVGNEFSKGGQIDYVLGRWNEEQEKLLPEILDKAVKANLDFVFRGMSFVSNTYNN